MKTFVRWMPLLIVLLVAALPVRADEAEARQSLERIYAAVADAIKAGDVETILGYEADNFSSKGADGQEKTREQADADFRQAMRQLQGMKVNEVAIEIEEFAFDEDKDEAIATTTQKIEATAQGTDGKPHKVVSTSRSRDTWRWHDDKDEWLIHETEELSTVTTVDGKPAK